jgi:hypothetical protein
MQPHPFQLLTSDVKAASRCLIRTTCVGCHRPPLGAGTSRRVSSSAATRTDSADTVSNTPRSSLARSFAAWAFVTLLTPTAQCHAAGLGGL